MRSIALAYGSADQIRVPRQGNVLLAITVGITTGPT
jgi:hypothetical protein